MEIQKFNIPSSFVSKKLKLDSDAGAGEAKLFVGSKGNEDQLKSFFSNFSDFTSYKIHKADLLDYLKTVKMEYVGQKYNKYKEIDYDYFKMVEEYVSKLEDSIEIKLELYSDEKRVYIRPTEDYKKIFNSVIRNLALPKITQVVVERINEFECVIKLEVDINKLYTSELVTNIELVYKSNFSSVFSLNRVLFGAPGTGKSHKLGEDMVDLLENAEKDYERVTFHPDYTFSQFVGTYKPVPIINKDGNEEISYQYVPGPFIRSYVKALKSAQTDNPKPYLLLIEEINRAKVAAVFGDIFQLLDRKNGVSEYPIRTSEDLRHYLANELKVSEDKVATLTLPDNLYIWATMNSADQGVFPMDTAFKRRWDFEYLELDGGEADIEGYKFNVAGQTYEWNALRKALNEVLSEDYNVNEDKLMGPFFIKLDSYKIEVKSDASNPAESDKKSYEPILSDKFFDVFKNKVLMYLFDDAAKQKRKDFFQGVENSNRYSVICKEFEVNGLQIFAHSVSKKYDEFASSDKD